jgi:hypothetical protein
VLCFPIFYLFSFHMKEDSSFFLSFFRSAWKSTLFPTFLSSFFLNFLLLFSRESNLYLKVNQDLVPT